jgi:hypothetical protein
MSIGGFMDSTSTASDSRIAATDQARVFRGGVGQNVESGAVGVSGNSTLLGAGSTQLTIKNKGGGSVTVQNMDPQVAQEAMDQISGLAGQFGQNLNDFMTKANNNALALASLNAQSLQTSQDSLLSNQNQQDAQQQTNFQSILDKMTGLISNQQPAGTVDQNRTMLYALLAVLTLVGVVFYYFRK